VREAGCGLVVPVDDEPALAAALADLLADPGRARALGEAGREAAATTFSWERCARDTLAVYQEVARP
jgi:glycosyltransferase involved in cell wall biosynthesis